MGSLILAMLTVSLTKSQYFSEEHNKTQNLSNVWLTMFVIQSKMTRHVLNRKGRQKINPEKIQMLQLAGKDFKKRVYLCSKM